MAEQVFVVGDRELQRLLRKMPREVKDAMKQVHADAAKIVERAALRQVPERTGRLKATIRSSGTQRTGVVRAGRKAVPYAGPIHWGWPARNITAQRFLTDPLADNQQRVVNEISSGLSRLFDKAWNTIGAPIASEHNRR